ncbi:MAG: SusC/RagA family TonB-linked outer membrane protein [Gemmatimonadetes bacterium]|nr:SusC/RagA family TonB-linked outer membrane protein [Gemmatimonadota bacterium]
MSARHMSAVIASLALGLAFVASPVAAQGGGSVTGLVTNAETQQPMVSAQVMIIGTNRGTLTNQAGRYLVPNVPAGTYEVRVVMLGFSQETRSITVTSGQAVVADFNLSSSAIEIDGITVNVITGEAQRARELGTNNGQIAMEDIPLAAVTSLEDVLSGRTEGLVLNGLGGTIGTGQKIRIRGANSISLSNEPLVFVDGIQFNSGIATAIGLGGQDTSRLDDINPNDIASIEILKGPAATGLYGTQAANGVILITTKKGVSGASRWNFYAEGGISQMYTEFEPNFRQIALRPGSDPGANPINADGTVNFTDYSTCRNFVLANGGCVSTNLQTLSFSPLNDPRTTPFDTGYRQRYGLNVAGGSDRMTYFLSGEYLDQVGVENRFADINTQERTTVRANITAEVNDRLNIRVNTSYTKNKVRLPNNDNTTFGNMSALLGSDTFRPADPDDPFDPVTNRRNFFSFSPAILANDVIQQNVDRLGLSGTANFRGTDWLSFNATGGLDFASFHDNETIQPNKIPSTQDTRDGTRQSTRSSNYIWTLNGSTVATRDVNDWIVSKTTVGGSYYNQKNLSTECSGVGLIQGTSSCGTVTRDFAIDEDFFQVVTVGFYGIQEFQFNDRLFVQGSVRADDNSAFGDNFGLQWYPSASVSWVISEEDFFDIGFIPELRVRGAFGTSGLRPNFRDAVTLFDPASVRVNGQDAPGVIISSTGNTDLEPERTTEFEVGFDAGLFNNKVGLGFTYFDKTSKDALISRRLEPSLGLNASRFANLGEVSNSGTETSLSWQAINTSNFGVDVHTSWSTFSNEITQLSPDGSVEPIIINRGEQRHQQGSSAGAFWLPDFTFNDANGDGLINEDEVTVGDTAIFLGHVLPTWQGSFSLSIRAWDWLSISNLFEARGGNKQLDGTESFRCALFALCRANNTPDASLEDQARSVASRFHGTDAGYIRSADFLKWREFAVTLDVPDTWLASVQGLSLTIAGRNLLTWTDYPGVDPEINEQGASTNFNSNEFLTAPPVRSYSLRLNWAF